MRALFTAALLLFTTHAAAQNEQFPARQPVRLVSSLAPGSSGDRLARTFADQLSARINQTVIVENRVGDGGNIAALHVVKAHPDGYTLLFSSTASRAIQMVFNADTVTYSFSKDLLPVSTTAEVGMPQLASMGLFGLLAPLRTAEAALKLLSQASVESLRDKGARAAREGVDLDGSAPEGLRRQIDSEMSKWSRLIKDANIKRE